MNNSSFEEFDKEYLYKTCKRADFRDFLVDNPNDEYFVYAINHGIYNEKPVFALSTGENQMKYFYSASELDLNEFRTAKFFDHKTFKVTKFRKLKFLFQTWFGTIIYKLLINRSLRRIAEHEPKTE
jgi:hypothetical protein